MCVEMGKANLANILLPPVKHKTEEKLSEGQQASLYVSGYTNACFTTEIITNTSVRTHSSINK